MISIFQYKWIKAEEDKGKQQQSKKRRTKTLNSSFGRKTTIRVSTVKQVLVYTGKTTIRTSTRVYR